MKTYVAIMAGFGASSSDVIFEGCIVQAGSEDAARKKIKESKWLELANLVNGGDQGTKVELGVYERLPLMEEAVKEWLEDIAADDGITNDETGG